jgi:hypothetical protein|tara:strand:- start:78 stop:1229 length:1152 start_codon:yes stop_codon:yes gene_type:complete
MKSGNISKILGFLIVLIIASNISYAFKANSSNYVLSPVIVSTGGDIVNSSNYKNYVATGIVAGIVNSTTYVNLLGFFYTWLLADGQACTTGNQCDGSFCCSNLCQSTSCPVDGPAPSGGAPDPAASGGGGAGLPIADFTVDKDTIKAELALSEESSETITITNTGDTSLDFSLSIEGEINEFATLSESNFTLSEGSSKTISLDIIAKNVGVFTGITKIKANGIEKIIAISSEIESTLSLFDVKLDIPSEYKKVKPGNNLKTQITLLNIGAPDLVDVIATYLIKDLSGNIIFQSSETFAVDIQKSFEKDFPIPKNLRLANYLAIIEIRYENSFAVSSGFFEVSEEVLDIEKQVARSKLISPLIIVILISVFVIFLLLSMQKRKK